MLWISAHVSEWRCVARLQTWRTPHATAGDPPLHHVQNNLGLGDSLPDALHHDFRAISCLLRIRAWRGLCLGSARWLDVFSWHCPEFSHDLCWEGWRGYWRSQDDSLELHSQLVLSGFGLIPAIRGSHLRNE